MPPTHARTRRVLTGITTSGTPHLGNYVGAIRPALVASRAADVESFYFLADYHSLVKVTEPARVQRSTLEIAASWLACGLDPDKVWFYRQSDIPEIPELTWLLTCVAGKGLLNRAHAYKAAVDNNRTLGQDEDAGINAGLFMYPVLMAADILLFNADTVPVGRDQVQHIEMTRDFAQRFNHVYGEPTGKTYFNLPEAAIEEWVATLPGLDGRKMSKSYDNVIPLFAPQEQLKKLVYSIVTDSRLPGEPKDADKSSVFELYRAFANDDETQHLRQAFDEGIAWGEAKRRLFERIDREIAPLRNNYQRLIAHPERIEAQLREGARRLRDNYATPFLQELREAVGLRNLAGTRIFSADSGEVGISVNKPSIFKQYREPDGRFYFKLVDGEGRTLLLSRGYASAREAGQLVSRLKQEGAAELHFVEATGIHLGDMLLGDRAEGTTIEEIVAALSAMIESEA